MRAASLTGVRPQARGTDGRRGVIAQSAEYATPFGSFSVYVHAWPPTPPPTLPITRTVHVPEIGRAAVNTKPAPFSWTRPASGVPRPVGSRSAAHWTTTFEFF